MKGNSVGLFAWGMIAWSIFCSSSASHEQTLEAFLLASQASSEKVASEQGETPRPFGLLEVEIFDEKTKHPLHGLLRVTDLASGEHLRLERVLERPMGWYASLPHASYKVPRGRIRIEACHGIETEMFQTELDFSNGQPQSIKLPLRRFYDPSTHHLRAGNTHLHLIRDAHNKMGVQLESLSEADRYLQVVSKSDGLDIVYVSYLTRPDSEYISNEYTREDFKRLSDSEVLFVNGEEYRHQGGIETEKGKVTYGHVMFLEIPRLIQPASLGPALTVANDATDGIPLRTGIRQVRAAGGTVVWCHGLMGCEAVPNWIDGLLHAQNIYDGGNEGTIDEVYYPYLNTGLKIPFSTGTDWGIWDFSRVYTPVNGDIASQPFLASLAQGQSFITNGTFLELDVEGRKPGGEIPLDRPGKVRVRARAIGRADFQSLQLVFNGKVIRTVNRQARGGHFVATLEEIIDISEPGWLTVRIPTVREYDIRSRFTGTSTNLLGKTLFAHTSPIYVSVAGRQVFQPEAAGELLARLQKSAEQIRTKGAFRSADEKRSILTIYEQATRSLIERIESRDMEQQSEGYQK